MLNYIFPYYDNVFEHDRGCQATGKVQLRHSNFLQSDFATIRNLAKSITNYKMFSKRSNNYIEQQTIKRNLNQLDDEEIMLIADCADEIIAVLYKYKMLCKEHQNIDYSEFVVEEDK